MAGVVCGGVLWCLRESHCVLRYTVVATMRSVFVEMYTIDKYCTVLYRVEKCCTVVPQCALLLHHFNLTLRGSLSNTLHCLLH